MVRRRNVRRAATRTFLMSKFAMGTYSGQKPRLGIWALAQAKAESARTIFPNMSDDDLPRVSAVAPTLYTLSRSVDRAVPYPFCVTHVLVLLRYSPWPVSPAGQATVIGQ